MLCAEAAVSRIDMKNAIPCFTHYVCENDCSMTMNIKDKLANYKPYLRETFHVKEIGIFGSYVSGLMNGHSDIDILVEFEDGHRDFFNYMRLKSYLENVFQRRVDLVMKRAIKPMLKKHILDEVEYV